MKRRRQTDLETLDKRQIYKKKTSERWVGNILAVLVLKRMENEPIKFLVWKIIRVKFMRQRIRRKLHLAEFLWTLTETLLHVFCLMKLTPGLIN